MSARVSESWTASDGRRRTVSTGLGALCAPCAVAQGITELEGMAR